MLLVDELLLLRVKGFSGIFRKIAAEVEREDTDEGPVKEELLRLQVLFETDQITEEEYTRKEEGLMKRLKEIRELQEGG